MTRRIANVVVGIAVLFNSKLSGLDMIWLICVEASATPASLPPPSQSAVCDELPKQKETAQSSKTGWSSPRFERGATPRLKMRTATLREYDNHYTTRTYAYVRRCA